jgi:hypothetical protein
LGLFYSMVFFRKANELGTNGPRQTIVFYGLMKKEFAAARVILQEMLNIDNPSWMELESAAEVLYKKGLFRSWIFGILMCSWMALFSSKENPTSVVLIIVICIILDLAFSIVYMFCVVKRHSIGFHSPFYILGTYLVVLATLVLPFVVFFLNCLKC